MNPAATSETKYCGVLIATEEIAVGERTRRDLGDLTGLRESIRAKGLLQPIVLANDHRLVAGERRLKAVQELGWDRIPVRIASNLDTALELLEAERDENTCRKDWTHEELVIQAKRLRALEEPAAKERQRHHGGTAPNRPTQHLGKVSTSVIGRTRDRLGQALGISGRTLEKAEEIVQAAEAEPEKFRALVDQMNRTGKVNGVHKRLKRLQQAEAIQNQPPPLPAGPFQVIVVDPPWQFDRKDDPTHEGACPYPCMTIEEIKALPVSDLGCEDSIVWLWVVNSYLRQSFEVLDAWGYRYKATLTWVKQSHLGLGNWLRGQTEHCLMAVKGQPIICLTNQTTALIAKATGHSRKPDEFYSMVEVLCPGSKLEMFQRRPRLGWVGYGDECPEVA